MWGIGTKVEHGSYFLDGEMDIKLNVKAVLIMTFCLLVIFDICIEENLIRMRLFVAEKLV